jgi:serine/threonine protein kinase
MEKMASISYGGTIERFWRRRLTMLGPWQVGDRIADRFDVFEVHNGGMGVVYLALDRLRPVGHEAIALKTLHDEFLPDHVRVARFAEECRLWIQLGRHPHIVQAFGVEEIGGKPYIVLERATGGELRSRIGTEPLDPTQALRHGVEFCLGMEHAIRQGLRCHRDVKPANLLISATGELKITDFGLAGLRDDFLSLSMDLPDVPIPLAGVTVPQPIMWTDPRDQPGPTRLSPPDAATGDGSVVSGTSELNHVLGPDLRSGVPSVLAIRSLSHSDPTAYGTIEYVPPDRSDLASAGRSRLTRTGAMLGTLPYMAPEQFRDSKTVDIRADIYSFGVVLFQMLTAELPFKGDTAGKFERQHARYEPPSVVPAISRCFSREAERIDTLVRRCLAKEPSDRFPTIGALRRSITVVLRRLDPDLGRSTSRRL